MGLYHHRFETLQEVGGKLSEHGALGAIDIRSPEYQSAYVAFVQRNRQLLEKFRARGIRSLTKEERKKLFSEGVKMVESLPAENPTHPQKPLLRDLRLGVANLLELQGEDIDLVKIYSSIGTPIDRLFGADVFIRLDDVAGKHGIYATFDYTTGRKKLKESGADVLIANLPDPDLAEAEYLKAVDGVAYDAVRIILRRKTSPTNTPY